MPAFINFSDLNTRNFLNIIERRYSFHDNGKNPLVFQHSFVEPDAHGLISLKMTFYEDADVYAAFLPKNFDPNSTLIGAFINTGAEVHVTFKDGKPDAILNKGKS